MFEEIAFSREVKLVHAEAAEIARRTGAPIDSAHVVLAIFTVPCEAHSVLIEKRMDYERVADALCEVDPEPGESSGTLLTTAVHIASNVASRQVTSVHLLLAVSRLPNSRAARVLERAGLPMFVLRTQAMAHLTDPRLKRAATERMASVPVTGLRPPGAPTPPRGIRVHVQGAGPATSRLRSQPSTYEDDDEPIAFETLPDEPAPRSVPLSEAPRYAPEPAYPAQTVREGPRPAAPTGFELDPMRFPVLCSLGRNLTAEAERGELDPLVGRDDSLDAIIDILCKRRSNNPILLGDPGVGKTALVEGLAERIVERPESMPGLEDKVIVSVSVADLVAGTAMRGSFAARLKGLKDEVLLADRRVVLFIDEIHTLIGAGAGDGGMDAANDLKGALARGQFPCIGATTFGEFKRYILSDDALRRRFEPVYVREPSLEEAECILAGVAPRYAEHHHVRFSEESIKAAVRLTDRVIPDRSLPAKAIDLLDRAGARVRREGRDEVARQDIVNVLSALADLPPDFLATSSGERLRGMEAALRSRVFGRDECVTGVVRVLGQNWARFGSRRPLGSFLFAGPAGSGRRSMAVGIASFLFASPSSVLEIDLADYTEAHSLSHLIGSPPGYVGHEEGGLLADALIRHPFQVVLWRHVEQGHPSVLGLISQILAEGTATDRRGRRMDFRNTVQVLCAGDDDPSASRARTVGFGGGFALGGLAARRDEAIAHCRKSLPAELFASVDQALYFPAPDDATLVRIANRMLQDAAALFREEHSVALRWDDAVANLLATACRATAGVASLEGLLAEAVLRPATDRIYGEGVPAGASLRATANGNGIADITVSVQREAPPGLPGDVVGGPESR